MWKTVRLGEVLKTKSGGTPLKSRKEYYENGTIGWLLSGAVCKKDIESSETFITELGLDNSSAKVFPKDTVLVAMYGATAGQVGILRFPSATNQAVCGIYPNKDYLPEFLYYYLTNYKRTLLERTSGAAQPNLSQNKIKDVPIPLLPLPDQHRIADFLDEKTSRIDGLIEKKRALLDRLAEKRQALITRAVTRGLNPDAPMKPSGIDWIGDIPAHWKRIRLRWLSRRYAGGTPNTKNPEYWDGGTIPWLKSGAVNQGTITEPSDHITELALKESSAKWIPKGALVMALAGQGKTKATVGFLGIRTTGNQSLAAIVPEKIDGKYLYWWLSSQYLTLRNLSSQDGRDGLNLDMIGSVVCPVPPLDTQRRIADFLDEKTARIDETAKQVLRSIEYLSEYRSALIAAAVTGQLAAAQTADLDNLSPQGD